MADVPPIPDYNGDIGDDDAGAPLWVKVLGIIAFVLVLLFVILHLTGRGLVSHTATSSVTERGAQQP